MGVLRYVGVVLICVLQFGCGAPEKQSRDHPDTRSPVAAEVLTETPNPPATEKEKDKVVEARGDGERSLQAEIKKEEVGARTLARGIVSNAAVLPHRAPVPASAAPDQIARYVTTPQNTEKYQHFDENPIKLAAEHPVSTFSIDVDTGSYANVRRFLNEGRLPPHDAVRVEELINYFPYAYGLPTSNERPFAVHTEIAPSPWNKDTHLLRVGIKGKDMAKASLPAANLVFLIDVSGSMDEPNKLPLLKTAFKLFTQELRSQDRVSMVVYAGASGVVLEPTSGEDKQTIIAALDRLAAGGSTHGEAGIELAYRIAQRTFIPGGINRVLLATDGDFNVGVTNFEALKNLIQQKRKSGISLSTLGFGTGNYNDQLMEQLADVGNGQYSYIDTLNEGRKVLVEEFTSTLAIIAKDVKIQVEFNPAVVAEYRLIGYENRTLKREDFNNDKVDAGEIGAGHTVTALYEIRLLGHGKSLIDPLRYQEPGKTRNNSEEIALLRLRHKEPEADESKLMEVRIATKSIQSFDSTSAEFRFAAAVAAFGQELRGGKYLGNFGYDDITRIGKGARSEDPFGYRAEFLDLVAKAKALSANPQANLEVNIAQ